VPIIGPLTGRKKNMAIIQLGLRDKIKKIISKKLIYQSLMEIKPKIYNIYGSSFIFK